MHVFIDDKATAMLLEEKNIDLDEKDMEGKTALDIAEANDQMEIVNYIQGRTYFKQMKSSLHITFHATDWQAPRW